MSERVAATYNISPITKRRIDLMCAATGEERSRIIEQAVEELRRKVGVRRALNELAALATADPDSDNRCPNCGSADGPFHCAKPTDLNKQEGG
jgi:predicted transcriptional regulator